MTDAASNSPGVRVAGGENALPGQVDYAVIFNAASNGMAFTQKSSGRILEVNAAWVRSTGFERAQWFGQTATALGLWARLADREACLAELERKGRVTDFEACLMMKSVAIAHRISAEVVAMGGDHFVLWEFRDTTQEKHLHDVLIESEAFRRRIFDSSRVPIVVMDAADLRYLQCNAATAQIYGLDSCEAVLGKTPMDFSAPVQYDGTASSEKVRHFIEKALSEGAVVFEWCHQRPDGQIWDAEVHLMRFQAHERTLLQFTLQDITERKRAVMDLKKSEEKFTKAFMVCPEAMAIAAMADGRYVDVNNAFLDMTGFQRSEVIGHSSTALNVWVDDAERQRFVDELSRAGHLHGFETRYRMHSGEIRDFLVSSEIVELEGERCSLNYVLDITQRKADEIHIRTLNAELERRVQERTAQLEAANLELEAFSYSVSHDLRGPLFSVDGFSRLLMEDYRHALDEMGLQHLVRIRRGAQRMGQIIQDLLKLSSLSRGDLELAQVDLSRLCGEVLGELQHADPGRRVVLSIQPEVFVSADYNLLRSALENLLGNAWKYTSRCAEALIEVGEFPAAPGERIFFVRDNGAGFDMASMDRLFKPFQRLHSAGEFEGTGIGLAIVNRVIQRHGGRIWAQGELGRGATFYFTLK